MADDLTPCTRCARHVRVTSARCPFCDAEVTASTLRELPSGLSRRALVALGAAFVAAGCRSNGRDDGSFMQVYGAPIRRTADVPAAARHADASARDAGDDAAVTAVQPPVPR